mgnify:CR=1 FL=1
MTIRTRRALTIGGAALALTLSLSGCSFIQGLTGGSDANRDDQGNVQEQGNIDIFSLKLGDCKMADDTTGEIQDADVVPCDQPHDEEVFFEYTMDDGEFDAAAIQTAGEEVCYGQNFTDFVGIPWDDSTLDVWYLSPTEQTWNQMNDRLIQCIISDPAGQTTGTLKDSKK